MPIKKDAGTGWHFVSYLVPVREKKRVRYQPRPLATRSGSLFGFITDLLRGGPNPFLASPIAFEIDRRVKLEKQARKAPASPGLAARLCDQIEAELKRYLHHAHGRADNVLDALDLETNEEETKLEECRPTAIKEAYKSDLDEVVLDVDGHLGPCARRLHARAADHDKFISDYGLDSSRGVHSGRRVDAKFLYTLLGVTAFEFILNTAFFSGSQRNGIIGGAALAMILSISTIFLGVCFGWAFQFSDARADGSGWRGRAGMIVLALATTFYLLLLTLARRAGDAGDLDMFATAAREIQIRPFGGILDLPALGYCFFTVGVISLVAWKFLDTMGHFPRIRAHKLAAEAAEGEFEDVQLGMIAELERRIDEFVAKLDDVPSIVQARKLALKETLVDYENVVGQLAADIQEMHDAQDIMVGVIRGHTGAKLDELDIRIGYADTLSSFRERLELFRARIDALLKHAQVNQSVIEKCRTEMTALGTRKRRELEKACEALRKPPAAPRAPRGGDPDKPGNVAWLRERSA